MIIGFIKLSLRIAFDMLFVFFSMLYLLYGLPHLFCIANPSIITDTLL